MNLYAAFYENFDLQSPFLIDQAGNQWTYGLIEQYTAKLANWLKEMNIGYNSHVLVITEKSPYAVMLYLACLRREAIYVPLNPNFTLNECRFFVDDCKPDLVICDDKFYSFFSQQASTFAYFTATLNQDGSGSLTKSAAYYSTHYQTPYTLGDVVACMIYTSGTTGKPKGAMLSHENLLTNGKDLANIWQFSSNDRLLHMLPIYHVHGLFFALHCVLLTGSSLFWLPRFCVHQTLQYIPYSTVLMGVPTFYNRLVKDERLDAKMCQNMRLFTSGSAPLRPDVFHTFKRMTGHTIVERYGMTETGINTSNPVNNPQPGKVGTPIGGNKILIADENGLVLSDGETGDVYVKGGHVFQGYWQRHDKTTQAFSQNGYFKTGDKGQIDPMGQLVLKGRANDMIITGGMNVYPLEVEYVINQYPGVVENAVVGVEDDDLGERVVVFIVCDENQTIVWQDLQQWLYNQLAAYKVPRYAHFVDELPKNVMGKILKNQLRNLEEPHHSN